MDICTIHLLEEDESLICVLNHKNIESLSRDSAFGLANGIKVLVAAQDFERQLESIAYPELGIKQLKVSLDYKARMKDD
jgi:hypothetical protein